MLTQALVIVHFIGRDFENLHENTAKEMFNFCKKTNSEKAIQNHELFTVIENQLSSGEDVLLCFVGLHNFVSMTKHDNNFAYAITNKRIIMAQKRCPAKLCKQCFWTISMTLHIKKGLHLVLLRLII